MVASDGAGPHFCSRALICVCGRSFLFMAGVFVSGCSSSVGGGHHHTWETVAVPGWGCLWVGSLFMGLGSRLWVPCHCLWVLGVTVGCQAVVWGW